MLSSYPSLIDRFPAYREQALGLRFRDSVIDELCRNHEDVMRALKALKTDLEMNAATREKSRELLTLARKLEHEFLVRLAQQGAHKQRPSKD